MTTRLKLVCHASTSAVRAAAFPADEPLEPQGLAKLTALAAGIGGADLCFSSPAQRALQTARALELDPAVEPALRDCDYGGWTGRSLGTIQTEAPDDLATWLRDPAAAPHGGESMLALTARVAAWMDGLAGEAGQVVAVTHASVIRAAVVHALDAMPQSFWRIDVAPLSLTRLVHNNGRWTLAALGPIQPRGRALG